MERICYNCFHTIQNTDQNCTRCGFPANYSNLKEFLEALPCGSILFGRYIIGRVLGQGGFGITYLALDHKRHTVVAVKEYFPKEMAERKNKYQVVPINPSKEAGFSHGLTCFLEEAATLAEFNGNPNIVKVHRYFQENGTAYFAMEYVKGTSLSSYISERGGVISWQEAWNILSPIMLAVEDIHSKGIIHRDIAPDNIIISDKGYVKLFDFGAARYWMGEYSKSLDVILKRGFAPVEQYNRHGRQGPYTDVYALAATFYMIITGVVPQEATERLEKDKLKPPSELGADIPKHAEAVLLKALSVRYQNRFQTMQEFYEKLAQEEPSGRKPQRKITDHEIKEKDELKQKDRAKVKNPDESVNRYQKIETARKPFSLGKAALRLRALMILLSTLLCFVLLFAWNGFRMNSFFWFVVATVFVVATIIAMIPYFTGDNLKYVNKKLENEGVSLADVERDIDVTSLETIFLGHKYALVHGLYPELFILQDLVWCYVTDTVTQHKVLSFIPAGNTKKWSVTFVFRDRSVHQIQVNQKTKEPLMQEIRARVPGVLIGYSDARARMFQNDFSSMVRYVDSKRQGRKS